MLTAVVTAVIFLVLISLHEFGHFIMSKLTGVRVLEFSIGMGPAIFKKQGAQTLYSVRILPIGGYCRLEGENEQTDDPKAFCNQKLYKRFLVIVAGAVFNVILGFVLFVVMTAISPHEQNAPNMINTPVIDTIVKNSNIENSGIMAGDKIVAVDGHKVHFYQDIPLYTDKFNEDTVSVITVKREGKKLNFEIIPTVLETRYTYGEDFCEITTVTNGVESTQKVSYDDESREYVKDYVGHSAVEKRLIIGFTPKREIVSVKNIFSYSYHYTGYVVRMVYKAFWDMITGKTGFSEVSGPVGIVSAVNTAVNTGKYRMMNILFLSALLTINLGVFNLLPLPALDGGRLLFLVAELVRGKPVPQDKEGMVHAIGLVLLLILSVVISFNDIMKLF